MAENELSTKERLLSLQNYVNSQIGENLPLTDGIKKLVKGDGANVTMEDNPDGGVDLTVDDQTRTLATESEVTDVKADLSLKQDALVNGQNIKTINGLPILGSGNLVIQGGGGGDIPLNVVGASNKVLKGEFTDISFVENNKYFDNDGNIIDLTGYAITDYIDVTGYYGIFRYGTEEVRYNRYNYVIYDVDKNIIGVEPATTNYDFVTIGGQVGVYYSLENYPNAVYVRLGTEMSRTAMIYVLVANTYNYIIDGSLIEYPTKTEVENLMQTVLSKDNCFDNIFDMKGYTLSKGVLTVDTLRNATSKYYKLPKNRLSGKLYFKASSQVKGLIINAYDENFEYVGNTTFSNTDTGEYNMGINACYIRMAVRTPFTGLIYLSTIKPSNIVNYDYDTVLIGKSTSLYGSTIVNFGDSIYGNFHDDNGYSMSISSMLEYLTGGKFINAGFGGCRMTPHEQYFDAFSMYRLADSINSGDWSVQENAISSGSSVLPAYFSETLTTLKGVIWENVDIITIGYGTNDYGGGQPIHSTDGSFSNEYDYMDGAIKYVAEKILTKYPHIKLVFVTPTYRYFVQNNLFSYDCDDEQAINSRGYKVVDYVNSIIDTCKKFHIDCVDNFNGIGMNRFNYQYYFTSTDGTHPKREGRVLLAENIAKELSKFTFEKSTL